jgi:hypothetical protein
MSNEAKHSTTSRYHNPNVDSFVLGDDTIDFLQNLEVCSLAKKELPSNRSVHMLHEDCEAIPDDVQRAKSEGYARSLMYRYVSFRSP